MLKLFKKGRPGPLIVSNIAGLAHEGNEYFAQDLILLNEALSGNLYCAENCIVEHAGALRGNVNAKLCVISGVVNGMVTGTERIEIKETAVINGDLSAPVVIIEPGAKINGKVKIATDIYAMVKLADVLKKNLPTEELPRPLNIAVDAVTLTPKNDEPAKAAPQKPSMPKPAAAASTAKQPEPVLATVKASKPVAAAVSANQQTDNYAPVTPSKPAAAAAAPVNKTETEEATVSAPVSKPAAAAPPVKKESDEAANGRWW